MAKRKSSKKRTITPEHLAKMQEGKRKAKVHRARVAGLSELGHVSEQETNTQRILRSVARKK